MDAGFGRGLLLRMQQSASPATAQMNPTKAAACSNHDGVTFPRMAACFFLVALRAFFLLPGNNHYRNEAICRGLIAVGV
jgi:hypothetical protein